MFPGLLVPQLVEFGEKPPTYMEQQLTYKKSTDGGWSLKSQLTFDVFKVQIHGVLADVISEQLDHIGHPLRNDGGLVTALPARFDQTLQEHINNDDLGKSKCHTFSQTCWDCPV